MTSDPEPLYARSDEALLAACRTERIARGGPGGQHANRTASAVRLTEPATGVSVVAGDSRDQHRNRSLAMRRMRLALACQLRGKSDPGWLQGVRHGSRLRIGPEAKTFPLVVGVLLDALAAADGDLRAAAAACGISATQMRRALVVDKQVHAAANALREQAGQPPLPAG